MAVVCLRELTDWFCGSEGADEFSGASPLGNFFFVPWVLY